MTPSPLLYRERYGQPRRPTAAGLCFSSSESGEVETGAVPRAAGGDRGCRPSRVTQRLQHSDILAREIENAGLGPCEEILESELSARVPEVATDQSCAALGANPSG